MVLKVNEFEYALDESKVRRHLIDRESNITYRAESFDSISSDDIMMFVVHHHERQKPRLELLKDYYEGVTSNRLVTTRRKEEDYADHRVSHPFAEYVSNFTNGYFLGKPVEVNYPSDDEKLKEETNGLLDEIANYNDIDSLNRELGLDLSIYGRAYEIIMKNTKDEYRVYRLNPEETFIIYDNSIEQNSLCAINYYPLDVSVSKETVYAIDVYSDTHVQHYTATLLNNGKLNTIYEREMHLFERVPITEYSNNKDRRGDFEKVIGLIDLYDNAQSDTANYMTDLNDALLVISGNLDLDADEAAKQKKANILFLEPDSKIDNNNGNTRFGSADAKYIYKQYDVSGSEAYKKRIETNIHLLTSTPNLNDENFSGNTSGEAMKYKLFGLEQKTVVKEGMFLKGLKRRFKLLQTIMQLDKELSTDVDFRSLEYTFIRNLPKSLTEDLKAFIAAGGQLSQETLIRMFGFVPDVYSEMMRVEKELSTRLPLYDWKEDEVDGEE